MLSVPVLWSNGAVMSLIRNYTLRICLCFLLTMALSVFFLCSGCLAADLSVDPVDGASSSAEVSCDSSCVIEDSSDSSSSDAPDESSAAEGVSGPDESVEDAPSPAHDGDVLLVPDPIEVEIDTDTYSSESDIVVNRADLQECIDLLNDLSLQLGLFTSDLPAGYEPTEDDLLYRDSLLETLSGIHDSLILLSQPAEHDALQDAQEDASSVEPLQLLTADVSESDAESSAAESDPADTSSASGDASSSSSLDDSTISQQDFYKLVLGFLFLLCLWPVLTWLYRFLSSFIPV